MIQWDKQSEFSKNVITLFTGSVLAQAMPIAVSPVLTRLYTPEDFGVFAVFFSVTTLFSTIATGRYELAIVLPHEDYESYNLEKLCFLISALVSLLLALLIFLFHSNLLALLGRNDIGNWLYAAPVSILFSGVIQTLSYRLNRNKKFKSISFLKVSQTGSTSITSLLLGWIPLLKNGLITGSIVGQGVAILSQWRTFKSYQKFDWTGVKHVAAKYKHFAFYNTPTALLDKAASSLPVFFLSRFFDKKITGFYGLVERVISAPASLVSYSFSQVLLEDIAHRSKLNLPTRGKILKVLGTLATIGLLPFSLLFFFAPQLFAFVFGPEWFNAGGYASILSIAFFVRFCVSPLSMIFIATNTLKMLTLWQTLYFIASFGVILYCVVNTTLERFLLFYTINDVVLYALYLFLILKVARK